MKYLLITDIPAPWREKVYEKVYEKFGNNFHVVYCNHNEKRRLWKFSLGEHPKTFLKTINIHFKGKKENYLNLGIVPFLFKHKPKIVICFSLVPTVFIAMFIARLIGSRIVVFADTWLGRDKCINWFQKVMRILAWKVFPDAYIGASKQTLNMFKTYNKSVNEEQLFLSPLCADNEYFNESIERKWTKNRKFDLMFSGRIVEEKNPYFFSQVAIKVKKIMGECNVLIIGDGDKGIKDGIFDDFNKSGIDYSYPGFIEHDKLPEYYSQSKILLFPTAGDCWGVVINEAFISGVPTITTHHTAAAGELVIDGMNGFILSLDSDVWAEKVCLLLKDPKKLLEFSMHARESVDNYNFGIAAEGIINAITYVENIQMEKSL